MPTEGGWRRAASLAALCAAGALLAGGCGDGNDGADSNALGAHATRTDTPEREFAPAILLDAREPWRPMSVRWLLDRAVLWFAEDQGCADRKVAVGRTLPEQRSANPLSEINWIFPIGLGEGGAAYFRNPYDDRCELEWEVRYRADQLTRPRDTSRERRDGLRPGEGFYLDLVDAARRGPDTLGATPVYWERRDEGDGQVRLTYWALFGMSDPLPGRPGTGHEGDWERVDVLLAHDGGDRYAPRAIQLAAGTARPRDIPWGAFEREGRHPLLRSARGNHTLSPSRPGEGCANCVRWRTWNTLRNARDQHWYGFGGAWGEVGATEATTGPLGPHRYWGVHPNDPSGQRAE